MGEINNKTLLDCFRRSFCSCLFLVFLNLFHFELKWRVVRGSQDVLGKVGASSFPYEHACAPRITIWRSIHSKSPDLGQSGAKFRCTSCFNFIPSPSHLLFTCNRGPCDPLPPPLGPCVVGVVGCGLNSVQTPPVFLLLRSAGGTWISCPPLHDLAAQAPPSLPPTINHSATDCAHTHLCVACVPLQCVSLRTIARSC